MSNDDEILVGTETPFMVENITIDQRYVFEKKIKALEADLAASTQVLERSSKLLMRAILAHDPTNFTKTAYDIIQKALVVAKDKK